MAERVKSLTRRWYPVPPSQFDPKTHVIPVHQAVFHGAAAGPVSHEIIDLLAATNYLDVLLTNLTPDASISHIELILLLQEGSKSLPTTDAKLELLLVRVLASTQVSESANFGLLARMMDFMASLCSSNHHTEIWKPVLSGGTDSLKRAKTPEMVNESIKENWIPKTMAAFFKWASCQHSIGPEALAYVEAFFRFLITVANHNPSFQHVLRRYNISVTVRLIPTLDRVAHLANALDRILRKESYTLESVQKIIFESFPDKLGDFINAPSKYAYSADKFKNYLASFSEDQLKSILSKLRDDLDVSEISGVASYKQVLTAAISDSVYSNDFLHESDITETVLDGFLLEPTYPLADINANEYLLRIQSNTIQQVMRDTSAHIWQVLSRVNVNPNGSVKNSSKYFYSAQVEAVSMTDYKVSVTGPLEEFQQLALIEISKPNKYAPNKRGQVYGLNMLRLGSIAKREDTGKKVTLTVESPTSAGVEKFCDRINYVIFIPKSTPLRVLSQFQGYFSDVLNLDDFLCVDSEALDGPREKRRCTNSGQTNEAILEGILRNNVNFIEKAPPSFISKINCALKGRTLIITSSETYNRTFDCSNLSVVKWGEMEFLKYAKSTMLEAASRIKRLFDFDDPTFSFDVKGLSFYESEIRNAWTRYTKSDPEKLLESYPFEKRSFKAIDEVIEHYTEIMTSLSLVKRLAPIWTHLTKKLKSNDLSEVWHYLFHNFDVIISYDEYLEIKDQHEFDNIIFVNGYYSELPVVFQNNRKPVQKVVIVGGDLFSLCRGPAFKVDDTTTLASKHYGFEHASQFIKIEGQVEEAEYCVALFNYMERIGYPMSQVCIVVHNLYHKALIEEVMGDKETRPNIVVSGEYKYAFDTYICAIVSLYGSQGCLKTYGKSTYFVGQKYVGTVPVPKQTQLEIREGERYGSEKVGTKKTVDKEHLVKQT